MPVAGQHYNGGSRNDGMGRPTGSFFNGESYPRIFLSDGGMFGLGESAKSTVQDDWPSLRYYDEGVTCTVTISVSWYLW